MTRQTRPSDAHERTRAARERDAAFTRIKRARVWVLGAVGVLSLGFAALARAVAPGHSLSSASTAATAASAGSQAPQSPGPQNPSPQGAGQQAPGPQSPASAPGGLSGYDQAPTQSSPPVVSGGS